MSLLSPLLLLVTAACASAQGAVIPQTQDLLSVMESLKLSTLLRLLQTAGFVDAFKGNGSFTIMAPSDEAFAKLDPKVLADVQADPNELTKILTFHVIPGTVPSQNITNGMNISTLLGRDLTFTLVDGSVKVNDVATVIQADVKATNGLVHVIDVILMPPGDKEKDSGIDQMMADKMNTWGDTKEDGQKNGSGETDGKHMHSMNLVDLALGEGLSTLVFLVRFAGLLDTFRKPGPFTIFAPQDTTGFSTLDPKVMDRAMTDPDFLVKLLSYHVISGKRLLSTDIKGNLTVATFEGDSIDLLAADDGKISLNGGNATVLHSDMIASNGVLHIIDRVLVPKNLMTAPGKILQVAKEKKLTTFLALVKEANLTDTLNGTGPYTVFAPSDDAFSALPQELLTQLKSDPAELKKVLLYHVVEGLVSSQSFQNDFLMPSLQGEALRLNIYPKATGVGMVTVGGSPVLRLDVDASNGALHLLERVLLPPKGNIADVIAKEKDLTTFVKALAAANMTEYLRGVGPITVMAPVDSAFAALPGDALTRLMGDKVLLKKLLEEHIVPLTLYEEGMGWNSVPSLGGPTIAFDKGASFDTILETTNTTTGLVGTELSATNGVIHKIRDVLFS